ncbi:MAG: Unknown protein [uncultured Sulfurovum sp.]|uniref:Periplasmic protein n=1 Tax=uncultured Sulfurovum sp. TaxID=269237 RepID=A0A6S6T7S9_9BACT|nr:MAG: Unknown protein [uncultured Sulfurovum sp.]
MYSQQIYKHALYLQHLKHEKHEYKHEGYMMKKTTRAILLTLGLGTATLLAFGGCAGHKGDKHRDGMMKVVKQLDLTSEQKSALKTLKKERKAEREAKREAMKENRKAMRAEMKPDMSQFMTAESFDKAAFKAHMTKKFDAKRKMMESKKETRLEKRAEGMEKVFNILTPEQRTKWIALSKETTKSCK